VVIPVETLVAIPVETLVATPEAAEIITSRLVIKGLGLRPHPIPKLKNVRM
jgi:hypothetical protein